MDISKKELTINQQEELLNILKERFEKNMQRHLNLKWDNVKARLENNPHKLWSLYQMEITGGEPDVFVQMNYKIIKAEYRDLKQILELQYLAYQSEARLLNNYNIPPLKQTFEELQQEFQNGLILKAEDELGKIIGSVRGFIKDNTLYIGKLIVQPAYQGNGIGTRLLAEIEAVYPKVRYELFTSDKSRKNLELYKKNGYIVFSEKQIAADLKVIYLEKYSGAET